MMFLYRNNCVTQKHTAKDMTNLTRQQVKRADKSLVLYKMFLKSSRLIKSLQIERSLLSLYCKNQDKHSSHVRSTEQRYNEIWNSASFVCGKTRLCLKKWPDRSHSKQSLQARKLAVNSRWLLRLHDAVFVGYEQHALQPLALAAVSEGVFCAVAYTRVCDRIVFVWFSARNLT